MKIFAFVQARMSSKRFPGKILFPLAGKTMLLYLIESLQRAKHLDGYAVLTSTDVTDDPVEAFCRTHGISYFRGSLQNVAERFRCAIDHFLPDAFIRISGDSPFIDHRLIDEAVFRFREDKYDLVTNVLERTFPKGQSVEIIRSACFLEALTRFETEEDREHVTPFFYRHSDQFRIVNFTAPGGNFSSENFCVDDMQGLVRSERIIKNLRGETAGYGWKELVDLSRQCAMKGIGS